MYSLSCLKLFQKDVYRTPELYALCLYYYKIEREKICEMFPGHKRLQLQVTIHKMEIISSGKRECTIKRKVEIKKIGGREKNKQNYDNMVLRVCYYKVEDGGRVGWVYTVHNCVNVTVN
jgi:hypothetical protein